MGSVRRPARDIGKEVEQFRRGNKWKPRKNPCERPPGQPDFLGQPGPMDFEVRFRVREAKTHLEFYGFGVWNEQTVDSNGLPGDFEVDRYHFQWKVTIDAAGNVYAHENGEKVRGHKTIHVADDNKQQTIEVTGASGGDFKLNFAGEETGAIAWNATAAQVNTALVALAGIAPADVSSTGGPLGTNPVVLDWTGDGKTPKLNVSDDDLTGPNPMVLVQYKDKYRIDFGRMQQPRRLYVSARLRVRAGAGCWSDWSLWTTPVHPIDGTSEPIPPAPTGTALDFQHIHSTRNDPIQAVVSGNYVGNWDVPGGDQEDDMARYHIQLQHSRDNGSTWEWPPQKKTIRDKDDNDGKWRVVFRHANRKWLYRYRVNSEDRFNRRGNFGPGAFNANQRLDGWSAQVNPNTVNDAAPAPSIIQADIDRSKLHLQVADYTGAWKDRIEYYEWEVYYDTVTAPNLQEKDEFHRGNSKVFPLRKPKGHSVIARVRSYTASDEASNWAQITCTAFTPPAPAIGAATFDALGPRHARYRAIVPVTVNDAGHNDNVDTIVVQMCAKVANATPTVSDKKTKDRVTVGDDPQEALFRNMAKGHYCFVRAKSLDGDRKESAWTSWTALGRPRDSAATTTPGSVAGLTVTTPTPRRLVGEWTDPDDDEVVRWKVTVKKGAATAAGYPKYTRTNRHVYRVPKPDVLALHTMEVIAVNDMGTESTLGSGTGTPDDDAAGTGVGNPPNVPSNPSFTADGGGTQKAKYRLIVTAGTSATDGTHDAAHAYIIQLAHSLTDTGASPGAGVKRKHGRVEGDATGDDLQEVFRGVPKRHYVWVRERARNAAGASAWTGWRTSSRSIDFGVAVAPNPPSGINSAFPVPGRMVTTWTDPDDDETVRWRVEIRKAGILVETGYTRSPRFVYNIPQNQQGKTHTARVFAISDTGTDSSQVDSAGGSDPGAYGDPVGAIKWHAGTTVPGGWMHADGTGLNTTTYPNLHAKLGYTYGGSGSTFNLPDIKNRKLKGKGNLANLGDNEGNAEGGRNDNHSHGGHKHGNHKHDNHQHNQHGHNLHGHQKHPHDGHYGNVDNDSGGHQHGAGGLSTQTSGSTNNRGTGASNVSDQSHSHGITGTTGPKDSGHIHSSQGGGNYVQGSNPYASGYHNNDGDYFVGSGHDENGSNEWINDNKGDLAEATNDDKRSPHMVAWAIIRVDDL